MRLCAAFDLQAVNAHFYQPFDVFHGAQVSGVHDVGAVFIFHDRHQFAGTVFFFQKIEIVGQWMALIGISAFIIQHIGRQWFTHALGIIFAFDGFVFPAAGIGAGALIRITPVEITRQQTAA